MFLNEKYIYQSKAFGTDFDHDYCIYDADIVNKSFHMLGYDKTRFTQQIMKFETAKDAFVNQISNNNFLVLIKTKMLYKRKNSTKQIINYIKKFYLQEDDKEHNFVIVPEQAVTMQRIYREYLYGYSSATISKHLTEEGIPSPSNKPKWYPSVILSILRNEKYYGGLICGKTFKPDVLSKKRYKNEGQVERYYIENSRPAIVTKEEFDMVQAEMQRRGDIRGIRKAIRGDTVANIHSAKR